MCQSPHGTIGILFIPAVFHNFLKCMDPQVISIHNPQLHLGWCKHFRDLKSCMVLINEHLHITPLPFIPPKPFLSTTPSLLIINMSIHIICYKIHTYTSWGKAQ